MPQIQVGLGFFVVGFCVCFVCLFVLLLRLCALIFQSQTESIMYAQGGLLGLRFGLLTEARSPRRATDTPSQPRNTTRRCFKSLKFTTTLCPSQGQSLLTFLLPVPQETRPSRAGGSALRPPPLPARRAFTPSGPS